jgi:bacterioferritin-associated ferredoxin
MYVCLCHGLTDRAVRSVAACGGGTIAEIYRALEITPTCGKCVRTVCDIVRGVETAGLTGQFTQA